MTTEEINDRLQKIEAMKDDDEMAHLEEDNLHQAFIAYVAELKEHLPELAAKAELVLKTREIEFSRWYA